MRLRSIARRAIGVWLMADGVATGLWFTGLADSLGGRDPWSVLAMVARVMVAALSVVAGWLVSQRRPPGHALGISALLCIAVFSGINAGTGVLPGNLDPSFRWVSAWFEAACAAAAVVVLRMDEGEDR